MRSFTCSRSSVSRAAALTWPFALFLYGFVAMQQASAESGPFAALPGAWSGTGMIRLEDKTERIRCQASYRLLGEHDVQLQLKCESDSYKFDLSGDFQADANNKISGRWTEHSRTIGGIAIGVAHGNRLQFHFESSALSGDLLMLTRSRSQSVTIDSFGGGQIIKASITLQRRSH
jgi:hypothetical protein